MGDSGDGSGDGSSDAAKVAELQQQVQQYRKINAELYQIATQKLAVQP